MQDYLALGSVPSDEPCAQVGSDNYASESRRECRRFKAALESLFPPPDGTRFGIKSFPHDFGEYREVVAVFDGEDKDHITWATEVENNCPFTWEEAEA
jgi:hypothetical protein